MSARSKRAGGKQKVGFLFAFVFKTIFLSFNTWGWSTDRHLFLVWRRGGGGAWLAGQASSRLRRPFCISHFFNSSLSTAGSKIRRRVVVPFCRDTPHHLMQKRGRAGHNSHHLAPLHYYPFFLAFQKFVLFKICILHPVFSTKGIR